MRNMIRRNLFLSAIAFVVLLTAAEHTSSAQSVEPGWYPYTVARGNDRTMIRQTPVHMRPYRPFHFYGNTQRRVYHRGTPFPTFSDLRRNAGVAPRNMLLPVRILTR